jgi:hypothetical protein
VRLWSLHPRVLDRVGLVALWREGLLARMVLSGGTQGYTRHPQLARFRRCIDPVATIDAYLHEVQREATARCYRFDATKLGNDPSELSIPVTLGQLRYEAAHLRRKVEGRDPAWLPRIRPEAHPIFTVIDGEVEPWERVS